MKSTKRDFLKKLGAISTAGLVGQRTTSNVSAQERGGKSAEDNTNNSRTYGQYGGGPGNLSNFDSQNSPEGIEEIEAVESIYGLAADVHAPITGTEGQIYVGGALRGTEEGENPDNHKSIIVGSEGDSHIIDTTLTSNNGLITENNNAIIGDAERTRKIDIDTAETLRAIEGSNRATTSMIENEDDYLRAFKSIGGGIGEIDLEEFEQIEEYDNMGRNPPPTGFAPFDGGDRFAIGIGGGTGVVGVYNSESKEIEAKNSGSTTQWYQAPISVTEDFMVASLDGDAEDSGLEILDLTNLDQEDNQLDVIDKLKGEGELGHIRGSSAVVDNEDNTYSIFNVDTDGEAFGYTLDLDEEELYQNWRKELDGEGFDVVSWGDKVIFGTDEEVAGFTHEGDEEFRNSDISGRPGMPHMDEEDGEYWIPVANTDGTLYKAHMQMFEPSVEFGDITVTEHEENEGVVSQTPIAGQDAVVEAEIEVENTEIEQVEVSDLLYREDESEDYESILEGELIEPSNDHNKIEISGSDLDEEGLYKVVLEAEYESGGEVEKTQETKEFEAAPKINYGGNYAKDTTGDGKLNDLEGNGFDLQDIQSFYYAFKNMDNPDNNSELQQGIEEHPERFDYDDDYTEDSEIDIFDAQELFNQYMNENSASQVSDGVDSEYLEDSYGELSDTEREWSSEKSLEKRFEGLFKDVDNRVKEGRSLEATTT